MVIGYDFYLNILLRLSIREYEPASKLCGALTELRATMLDGSEGLPAGTRVLPLSAVVHVAIMEQGAGWR